MDFFAKKKFDLKSLESSEVCAAEDTSKEQLEPGVKATPKVTWRHCLLGPIGFLYFSGMQMSVFTINQYVYRRIQLEEYPNKTFDSGESYCTRNESDLFRQTRVQQKAAEYSMLYSLVAGIPATFITFFLGASTDSYGRKFLMLTSMTGTLLRIVVCLIAVYTAMDLDLIAIGFVLEGLLGQPFTFLQACYSYASDITTRKRRAIGIILVELSIGLGSAVTTFAVGYLVQDLGFADPYIVSAALVVSSIVLVIFLLPESYSKEKRSKKTEKCINMKHAIGFYISKSNYGKRWKYIVTISAFFLTLTCLLGRNNVETLYQMNAPFCWTPTKLGWFGALRIGIQQVGGMTSAAILKQFLADDTIAMIGCVSYAACFILEALAKTDVLIYIVTVVGSLGLLTLPMTRSILSSMTSPNQQGALAASISSVETICHMFAVALMNAVYKRTVKTFGGAVFLLMASFNGLTLLLLLILKVGSRGDNDGEDRGTEVHMVSLKEKTLEHM